jgi:Ni/Fe-hydrogenase subunit HybB-like protein
MYTQLVDRPFGPYAGAYWGVLFCNCVVVQALWSRKVRTSPLALFVIAGFIQVGMWGERFMLIITSLHADFLPSSWRTYTPSWIDWTILGGTIAFFLFLFVIFLRFVPFIPISELKELRRELAKRAGTRRANPEGHHA